MRGAAQLLIDIYLHIKVRKFRIELKSSKNASPCANFITYKATFQGVFIEEPQQPPTLWSLMEALWHTHSTVIISVAVAATLAVAAAVWSFVRGGSKQSEIEHLKSLRRKSRAPTQQASSPKRPASGVQAQAKTLLQSTTYVSFKAAQRQEVGKI